MKSILLKITGSAALFAAGYATVAFFPKSAVPVAQAATGELSLQTTPPAGGPAAYVNIENGTLYRKCQNKWFIRGVVGGKIVPLVPGTVTGGTVVPAGPETPDMFILTPDSNFFSLEMKTPTGASKIIQYSVLPLPKPELALVDFSKNRVTQDQVVNKNALFLKLFVDREFDLLMPEENNYTIEKIKISQKTTMGSSLPVTTLTDEEKKWNPKTGIEITGLNSLPPGTTLMIEVEGVSRSTASGKKQNYNPKQLISAPLMCIIK